MQGVFGGRLPENKLNYKKQIYIFQKYYHYEFICTIDDILFWSYLNPWDNIIFEVHPLSSISNGL